MRPTVGRHGEGRKRDSPSGRLQSSRGARARTRLRALLRRCAASPRRSPLGGLRHRQARRAAVPEPGPDFRCAIHARLRQRGFPGCAAYDCFGAGQQVAQHTFAGVDWRRAPGRARGPMFAAFARHAAAARAALAPAPRRSALARPRRCATSCRRRSSDTDGLTAGPPGAAGRRRRRRAGAGQRPAAAGQRTGPGRPPAADRRGADLIGADLRSADLRRASLRGALLLGADLRGPTSRAADLTGADLRAADLRGADLRGALFLTQAQLDSARGDAGTRVPDARRRPAHW